MKIKLKPEVKKQWIIALRSGDYRQGKEALKLDDKFCCLGVLCDIHNKHLIDQKKKSLFNQDGSYRHKNDIPRSITNRFAGLGDKTFEDLYVQTKSGKKMTLFQLNDMKNNYFSFNKIADIIEEQL